jgi:hypothetical protein
VDLGEELDKTLEKCDLFDKASTSEVLVGELAQKWICGAAKELRHACGCQEEVVEEWKEEEKDEDDLK